jgi:hypothetical protein
MLSLLGNGLGHAFPPTNARTIVLHTKGRTLSKPGKPLRENMLKSSPRVGGREKEPEAIMDE